tara:strand:- start:1843 stop:2007 length:165 start_codon:yes stop_codon:yes gene_type:complete
MPNRGRPVGTTKANGYKVSPGRPRRKKEIHSWDGEKFTDFKQKILDGFKNLLSK